MIARAGLVILSAMLLSCGCASNNANRDDLSRQQAEAVRVSIEAQQAQKAGYTDRAIALYQEALKLDGEMGAAWNNLGTLLLDKKEYQSAATAYRRAADLSPSDPRPYENLGLLYRQAGWRDDSVKYYEMALERDPDSLPALRGFALAAKEQARADEITRDRLRRAMMVEKDEAWRSEFQSQLLRVEAELGKSKDKPGELPFSAPATHTPRY
jgi:Tfp pilus assembly protein PilF